ncbi:response regulator [Myxococcota bacterium]
MAGKSLIYVVDDEQDALDLYVRTLSSLYEVQTFSDPRDALAQAATRTPALLIVDHKMPQLTGVQLVRELRKSQVECATLMVTGFPEWSEVMDTQREGLFFQVIPKPCQPKDLLAQVALALSSFRLGRAVGRLDSVSKAQNDKKSGGDSKL